MGYHDKIALMKTLSDLDHWLLEPAIKAQVTELVQGLTDALAAKESVLAEKEGQLELNTKLIAEKEVKIQALAYELAQYKRIRFGTKNEALSTLQRDLFREDVESDVAAIEAELQSVQATPRSTVAAPRDRRPSRQPLPDHLPRIDHRHEPESCTCGQCGSDLQFIRDEISEQLDVEPAQFFVHRHIRPQYACRTCETVVAGPVPPAIIDGGLAAIGLLVWVIISKYMDYLPLYRLEQVAQRSEVHLARSSLCQWVGQVGVAFQPVYERLTWHLLQGGTLLADETPVPQLDPGRGKTKKAYIWAYRSNDLQPDPDWWRTIIRPVAMVLMRGSS
jgi:transposase